MTNLPGAGEGFEGRAPAAPTVARLAEATRATSQKEDGSKGVTASEKRDTKVAQEAASVLLASEGTPPTVSQASDAFAKFAAEEIIPQPDLPPTGDSRSEDAHFSPNDEPSPSKTGGNGDERASFPEDFPHLQSVADGLRLGHVFDAEQAGQPVSSELQGEAITANDSLPEPAPETSSGEEPSEANRTGATAASAAESSIPHAEETEGTSASGETATDAQANTAGDAVSSAADDGGGSGDGGGQNVPRAEMRSDNNSLVGTPPQEGPNASAEREPAPIPEPAPADSNRDTPTSQEPVKPKTETEIQAAVQQEVANLAPKVKAIVDALPQDSPLRAEYDAIRKQLISDELQRTIDGMNTKAGKSLQERIDMARSAEEPKIGADGKVEKDANGNVVMVSKPVQMELAHVLEERQARIKELQEQAERQAALELRARHPDNQALQDAIHIDGADSTKVQEAIKQAHKEADARRTLATEELKSEKERADSLEFAASLVDKAEQGKKANEARVRREELNIIRGIIEQGALQALVNELSSTDQNAQFAAHARLETLRRLAHVEGNPLNQNKLLKEATDFTDLERRVRQQGVYLQTKAKLYRGISGAKRVDDLLKIAKDADFAAKSPDDDAFEDAKLVYEAKLKREMDKIDLEAKRVAGMIAPDQYQEIKAQYKRMDELSKEDEEKAKKQVKQKFKFYRKKLRNAWKDWWKAETPEDKAKARKELLLSLRGVALEGAKKAIIIWLLANAVFLLAAIAIEMRIAGKMFGQDGGGR